MYCKFSSNENEIIRIHEIMRGLGSKILYVYSLSLLYDRR